MHPDARRRTRCGWHLVASDAREGEPSTRRRATTDRMGAREGSRRRRPQPRRARVVDGTRRGCGSSTLRCDTGVQHAAAMRRGQSIGRTMSSSSRSRWSASREERRGRSRRVARSTGDAADHRRRFLERKATTMATTTEAPCFITPCVCEGDDPCGSYRRDEKPRSPWDLTNGMGTRRLARLVGDAHRELIPQVADAISRLAVVAVNAKPTVDLERFVEWLEHRNNDALRRQRRRDDLVLGRIEGEQAVASMLRALIAGRRPWEER